MMCESPLFLNRFSVLYVFVGLVLLVGFFYIAKKNVLQLNMLTVLCRNRDDSSLVSHAHQLLCKLCLS